MAEIDIGYDDDGDIVWIGGLDINRNPDTGFVESTELLGVADERDYNGYGECTNYVAAFEGDDLYQTSLKRDALGRVVERDERVLSGDVVTSRYEYDVRGRLVSVTTNGVVAESYAYDANGNRLGGEYDAQDRQLAYGGAAYAYDLNGSMTNRNGAALEWNLFGRLMSVGDVFYWRDEQQRLCYKEMDGELVKNWMWSGSRLVAEYDCAAEEISVFVYAGATAPAYMIRGDVTYRIVTDNQGSVRLVVNTETGEIAQRLDYDSFGRVLRDTNPGFQPFGFQGGLYDPDTGLVEFGCRWYDAETGRWISKDPILLDGGWNVYAFCDNDPVNRTDPTGMCESVAWAWVKGFGQGFWEAYADGTSAKAVAATMDGMIPFCDPFEGCYANDDGTIDREYEVSRWCGIGADVAFVGACLAPGGMVLGGSSSQVVTHWSVTGAQTLRAGEWVMMGTATLRNWIMAGGPQMNWDKAAPYVTSVPKSALSFPRGWEWFKGLLGQRIYTP